MPSPRNSRSVAGHSLDRTRRRPAAERLALHLAAGEEDIIGERNTMDTGRRVGLDVAVERDQTGETDAGPKGQRG